MASTLTAIARARAEKGLTLREVELLSGVHRDTVHAAERRTRRPHLTTLAKIARSLGLDLQEVLEDYMPAEGAA